MRRSSYACTYCRDLGCYKVHPSPTLLPCPLCNRAWSRKKRPAFLLASLLACLLALAGCATSADVPVVLSQPVDSTLVRQAHAQHLAALLQNGRVKFKGPVVIQLGGANNSASATAVAKAKAPVAAAPHAAATETRPGSSGAAPWWLWVLLPALAFAGGLLLRYRLRVPGVP